MARVKLFLAFVALVILAAGIAASFYYFEKIARPNWHVSRGLESERGQKQIDGPDLGIREYDAAIEMLQEGEYQAARDRLYYLMEYYPDSSAYPEAKRIIGELNLDLLVSKLPVPGKTEHVVKSGDTLNVIARRNQCTIDYIMRANGRTTPLIHPDDHLTVFPLNFSVNIDLGDQAITLYREDGTFFKEYPIRETNLPPILKPPIATEISEKVAWFDGRSINFTSKNYLNCSKWIRTRKMGLFIRMVSDDRESASDDSGMNSESSNFGVMIDRSDLEELFTILRVGTKITLTE